MEIDGAAARPLEWDYSRLAADYELRAPYHPAFADWALAACGIGAGATLVDIGSGTGRVASAMAARGCSVDAVEPCAEMAAIGRLRTAATDVRWHCARGESTGLAGGTYDAACFGSSLNVVDAGSALREAHRLLRPGGALIVLYNHRELSDPLQQDVETAIRACLPAFEHGTRRSDPTECIEGGGWFRVIAHKALAFAHSTSREAFVDGFSAHATLVRQAGAQLAAVLARIDSAARAHAGPGDVLQVPFATQVWVAVAT